MKFTQPFHYYFSYVPIPNHNPNKAIGGGKVDLEIREINSDSIPVAMKVGNPKKDNNADREEARFSVKADGTLREVRILDGKYFVETDDTIDDFQAKLSRLETTNTAFQGMVTPILNETVLIDHQKVTRIAVPTSVEDVTARHMQRSRAGHWVSLREGKTEDDGGAKVKKRLKFLCDNMLFVDGRLFARCREPILTLKGYSGKALRIVDSPAFDPSLNSGDYETPKFQTSYRSDEMFYSNLKSAANFLSFAASQKALDGRTNNAAFEVVDPFWSRYDGPSKNVRDNTNSLLQAMRQNIYALPRDLLDAYYQLEEVYREADRDLFSVSPALLHAIDAVAAYRPEKTQARDMAIGNFEALKAHRDKNGDTAKFYPGNTLSLADSRQNNTKDIVEFSRMAKVIKSRWESRAAGEYFESNPTWNMTGETAGLNFFELNSEFQLATLAQKLDIDVPELIRQAHAGKMMIVIADKDGKDVRGLAVLEDDTVVTIHAREDQIPAELEDAVHLYLKEARDITPDHEFDGKMPMGRNG